MPEVLDTNPATSEGDTASGGGYVPASPVDSLLDLDAPIHNMDHFVDGEAHKINERWVALNKDTFLHILNEALNKMNGTATQVHKTFKSRVNERGFSAEEALRFKAGHVLLASRQNRPVACDDLVKDESGNRDTNDTVGRAKKIGSSVCQILQDVPNGPARNESMQNKDRANRIVTPSDTQCTIQLLDTEALVMGKKPSFQVRNTTSMTSQSQHEAVDLTCRSPGEQLPDDVKRGPIAGPEICPIKRELEDKAYDPVHQNEEVPSDISGSQSLHERKNCQELDSSAVTKNINTSSIEPCSSTRTSETHSPDSPKQLNEEYKDRVRTILSQATPIESAGQEEYSIQNQHEKILISKALQHVKKCDKTQCPETCQEEAVAKSRPLKPTGVNTCRPRDNESHGSVESAIHSSETSRPSTSPPSQQGQGKDVNRQVVDSIDPTSSSKITAKPHCSDPQPKQVWVALNKDMLFDIVDSAMETVQNTKDVDHMNFHDAISDNSKQKSFIKIVPTGLTYDCSREGALNLTKAKGYSEEDALNLVKEAKYASSQVNKGQNVCQMHSVNLLQSRKSPVYMKSDKSGKHGNIVSVRPETGHVSGSQSAMHYVDQRAGPNVGVKRRVGSTPDVEAASKCIKRDGDSTPCKQDQRPDNSAQGYEMPEEKEKKGKESAVGRDEQTHLSATFNIASMSCTASAPADPTKMTSVMLGKGAAGASDVAVAIYKASTTVGGNATSVGNDQNCLAFTTHSQPQAATSTLTGKAGGKVPLCLAKSQVNEVDYGNIANVTSVHGEAAHSVTEPVISCTSYVPVNNQCVPNSSNTEDKTKTAQQALSSRPGGAAGPHSLVACDETTMADNEDEQGELCEGMPQRWVILSKDDVHNIVDSVVSSMMLADNTILTSSSRADDNNQCTPPTRRIRRLHDSSTIGNNAASKTHPVTFVDLPPPCVASGNDKLIMLKTTKSSANAANSTPHAGGCPPADGERVTWTARHTNEDSDTSEDSGSNQQDNQSHFISNKTAIRSESGNLRPGQGDHKEASAKKGFKWKSNLLMRVHSESLSPDNKVAAENSVSNSVQTNKETRKDRKRYSTRQGLARQKHTAS